MKLTSYYRRCEFDVLILTLQQRCQYNIHSTTQVKLTFEQQIAILTLKYPRRYKVV